jgi:hypothetical protein
MHARASLERWDEEVFLSWVEAGRIVGSFEHDESTWRMKAVTGPSRGYNSYCKRKASMYHKMLERAVGQLEKINSIHQHQMNFQTEGG